MNLLWTILVPFGAALLVLLLPQSRAAFAKWVALAACGIASAAAAQACLTRLKDFDAALWTFDREWIPALGIRFCLEADGISLALVLLVGIVAVAGVLCSWNVERRQRAFFAFYLVIIGASSGVFLSRQVAAAWRRPCRTMTWTRAASQIPASLPPACWITQRHLNGRSGGSTKS